MSQKSRESILRTIQKALETPTGRPVPKPDFASPVYTATDLPDEVVFAEVFKRNKGEFYYCESEADLLAQLPLVLAQKKLEHVYVWEEKLIGKLAATALPFHRTDAQFTQADAGITLCECLIARTGSILVSSRQQAGRRLTIYPHVHVVVAYTSQVVPDIKDGLALMAQRYGTRLPSMLSMITGPSRTADIEKTLVLGAHGPKELLLFLVEG